MWWLARGCRIRPLENSCLLVFNVVGEYFQFLNLRYRRKILQAVPRLWFMRYTGSTIDIPLIKVAFVRWYTETLSMVGNPVHTNLVHVSYLIIRKERGPPGVPPHLDTIDYHGYLGRFRDSGRANEANWASTPGITKYFVEYRWSRKATPLCLNKVRISYDWPTKPGKR